MKGLMMKEHEKLTAFVLLIFAIVGLAILASTFDKGLATDVVVQGKLRIIDSAITGLLAIGGMAAQALFRIGESVKIDNKPNEPVPTTDSGLTGGSTAPADGELPEDQRL